MSVSQDATTRTGDAMSAGKSLVEIAKEKNRAAGEAVADAARSVAPTHGAMAEGRARQMGNRGQLGLGTILAALVVVIAVSLALIVVDQFDQSLGNPDSSQLSTAQTDVLSGFADMTSLVGPLLLVAIAVVIIGLVRRVQGD